MQCVHHPQAAASAICTRCDQPLCNDCTHERNGRTFCAACAEFLDQRATRRPTRPSSAAMAAAPPPPPSPPVADDGLYQVPAATEDGLYQGPAAAADGLYQRPAPGSQVMSDEAVSEASPGTLGRAALFGAIACVASMLVWYGMAIATDRNWALVAALMGWATGLAVTAGAGRGGSDLGLMAVVMFLVSMVAGEYLIFNKVYRDTATTEALMESIGRDGAFTEEEATMLMGAISNPPPESLPFGEFLGILPVSLGIFGWLCVGIGAYEAFKIPVNASAS
jgi:hypothetical protein